MTTKITALTPANIDALAEAQESETLGIELTATTATFPGDPEDALAVLAEARDWLTDKHGTRRGHPVQSLAAVRRKLDTAHENHERKASA